jgi:hypothetical protein
MSQQAAFTTDKQTDEIIAAWRSYFDQERPGSKASASEVVRALIIRAGMPPTARKSNRKHR